jgi:hypothetical protein
LGGVVCHHPDDQLKTIPPRFRLAHPCGAGPIGPFIARFDLNRLLIYQKKKTFPSHKPSGQGKSVNFFKFGPKFAWCLGLSFHAIGHWQGGVILLAFFVMASMKKVDTYFLTEYINKTASPLDSKDKRPFEG